MRLPESESAYGFELKQEKHKKESIATFGLF